MKKDNFSAMFNVVSGVYKGNVLQDKDAVKQTINTDVTQVNVLLINSG